MAFALFDGDRQIGPTLPSEPEVWKRALDDGVISDIPVADEAGGQVLPENFHIKEVREECAAPDPKWKLPREIS